MDLTVRLSVLWHKCGTAGTRAQSCAYHTNADTLSPRRIYAFIAPRRTESLREIYGPIDQKYKQHASNVATCLSSLISSSAASV